MAAVRSSFKQGAPFSAWEAVDTLFEQAFSLYSTFSPRVASPELADHFPRLHHSFGLHDSYHKSIPVSRQFDNRRDSLSSSTSSVSSESFEFYRMPQQTRSSVASPNTSKSTKLPKVPKVQPALTLPAQVPQPKARPRTSRVRYSESTGATQSAIFSLPRVVNGDVHIGFTAGQLEIKWEYTKTKKVQEGDRVVTKQKQKKFTKVLMLREGTLFSQIKANLTGRQLTITYPK